MHKHNGSVMRAINVPEVQAHFAALVEQVMPSASGPRSGKGPTAITIGRMKSWLGSNGYLN
jgi:hypothetical protein